MFDKYLITADSVRNVTADGAVIGFEFAVRIGYYRGLALSMVEPFDVVVDGEAVASADLRFTVSGKPSRSRRWRRGTMSFGRWPLTASSPCCDPVA